MRIKNYIPNFITLLNLFCGCLAIVAAFKYDLTIAAILVFAGGFFDYFDGTAARLLNAKSDIGKELDSLADVVTFGVVPSIIVFQLLNQNISDFPFFEKYYFLTYFPFLIALFSAIRLAKFNIDDRQTVSFLGLPTPANAIFWASAPLIIYLNKNSMNWGFDIFTTYLAGFFQNPYFLIVMTLVMSILLIVEIPLFSLKFKDFKIKNNVFRFIFLILSILLLIFLNVSSLPLIILLYILLSIIQQLSL